MNNKFNTLVLDVKALDLLSVAKIDMSWFGTFNLPLVNHGIKKVVFNDLIYLMSEDANLEDSKFLILNLALVKKSETPSTTFDRIVTVALAELTKNVSVNIKWAPYREDSLLSVYASNSYAGNGSRIYFELNPKRLENTIFAYAITSFTEKFDDVSANNKVLLQMENTLIEALSSEGIRDDKAEDSEGNNYGIVLLKPSGLMHFGEITLEEWLTSKLTNEQLKFVKKPLTDPVRLRGAAGTGKTVALAVKCLNDYFRLIEEGEYPRFAFITHSVSLANDVVRDMFNVLDPTRRWMDPKLGKIWLGSIYELAKDRLNYQSKSINPLSLDGREGIRLQIEALETAISIANTDMRYMKSILPKCSSEFKKSFQGKGGIKDRFITELSHEFSSVIDADRIKKGTPEAENYLNGRRERWKMLIDTRDDRLAVLELHGIYSKFLREMNSMSLDQMIADFNNHIRSNEWEYLINLPAQNESSEGFDAIFVDELHYFNLAERMTFRNLFRPSALENGKPPLFMAYDLKQDTNDQGLNIAQFFKSLNVGGSDFVELTEVFRSTPQIASFLKDLDSAYPPLDLEEEWGTYNGESKLADGDTPQLLEYESKEELLKKTFEAARRQALQKGGRNVAVLCVNGELFDTYVNAGVVKGMFTAVESRDDVLSMRSNDKTFVFSMPEYVAGLQFDTVFLIHVDDIEISNEDSIGAQRRFISSSYLGASRAAQKLYVVCCNERGGRSSILESAIANKSVHLVA